MDKFEFGPYIRTNSPIFSPLVTYTDELGTVPFGTVITITGEPGSGKSRYAMQLLENIRRNNIKRKTVFYSYEMHIIHIMKAIKTMGLHFVNEMMENGIEYSNPVTPEHKDSIILIDSVDAWNDIQFKAPHPDVKMAEFIKGLRDNNNIVIIIHHTVKGSRTETGVGQLRRINDIKIEILKSNNDLTITTRRKNRWATSRDQIFATHTKQGIAVKTKVGFMDVLTSMKKRILGS